MLLTLLLVLEVIIAFFLVVVVLLQRSEGGGLVGGGGGNLMSVRGQADLLTRTTWILGTAFFVLGLLLTVLEGRSRGDSSVVDRLKVNAIDPSSLIQEKQSQPPAGTAQPGPAGSAPAPLQAPTPQVNNPFLAPQPAPAQPATPAAPAPK